MSSNVRGDLLLYFSIALLCVSTIVIALRIYVRAFIIRALGPDDIFACIGYLLVCCISALHIAECRLGAGQHEDTVDPAALPEFHANLVTIQLLYYLASSTLRLAVLTFLPRLKVENAMMCRSLCAVGIIIVAVFIICFTLFLTECKYAATLWLSRGPSVDCPKRRQDFPVMMVYSGIGIGVDLVLFLLPVWIVWTTMLVSKKLWQVMLVLSVGLAAVIAGVVRLTMITITDFSTDRTYKLPYVAPWTAGEIHIGLWVACIPALPPVVRAAVRFLGYGSSRRPLADDSKDDNGGTRQASLEAGLTPPTPLPSEAAVQGACGTFATMQLPAVGPVVSRRESMALSLSGASAAAAAAGASVGTGGGGGGGGGGEGGRGGGGRRHSLATATMLAAAHGGGHRESTVSANGPPRRSMSIYHDEDLFEDTDDDGDGEGRGEDDEEGGGGGGESRGGSTGSDVSRRNSSANATLVRANSGSRGGQSGGSRVGAEGVQTINLDELPNLFTKVRFSRPRVKFDVT